MSLVQSQSWGSRRPSNEERQTTTQQHQVNSRGVVMDAGATNGMVFLEQLMDNSSIGANHFDRSQFSENQLLPDFVFDVCEIAPAVVDEDESSPSIYESSLYSLLDGMISPCSSECEVTSKSKQGHRRRVSFSDTMHVRTHSVVMGDHPCCRQLALELGWEHDDGSLVDMEGYLKGKKKKKDDETKKLVRRRNYLERKFMLKEVGGMTEEDIHLAMLRHAAPSLCEVSAIERIRRSRNLFEVVHSTS